MRTVTTILTLGILGVGMLHAADGAALAKRCTGCHGASFEKHALGKSQVVKGWKADKVVTALKGYKAGTYGNAMKGVMKGQVANLSDADIEALAKYIEGLK